MQNGPAQDSQQRPVQRCPDQHLPDPGLAIRAAAPAKSCSGALLVWAVMQRHSSSVAATDRARASSKTVARAKAESSPNAPSSIPASRISAGKRPLQGMSAFVRMGCCPGGAGALECGSR